MTLQGIKDGSGAFSPAIKILANCRWHGKENI
jgi:hypothetical protein